jgi:catechol 2,3-dioxygenase-like lactoylglutathione lyase family enzyme
VHSNYTSAILTLASHNFEALVEFYSHLLNQEPATVIPAIYAEFQLEGLKLGIFRPRASEQAGENAATQRDRVAGSSIQNSSLPPSGMSLCLEVEDLEAVIAHLTQLGCPPPGKILTASHGREIYAYDPDGNWLILHQARG